MKARPLLQAAAAALPALSWHAAHAVLPTVASPAAEPHRSFAAAGLLQAGLGLAVVIGLIFLFAWGARRLGLQPSGNGKLLKVVSSAMVGQRERVVVVEIGDAWLVLGVAAGQVRALHTMPAQGPPETQATPAVNGFAAAGAFSQKLLESINRVNKPGKRT
ncbi:MAG: flagellar biosynthesis protein FliO [Polaromonas sp.]|nr:flagellar biosynthesis protein FliO [Polaromonas sp.]MDB5845019.1 flagellar biosynthesis protein FliO [Polaromonas sp.]